MKTKVECKQQAEDKGGASFASKRNKGQTEALQSAENLHRLIEEAKAITAARQYLEEKNEEERQAVVEAFLRERGEIFLAMYEMMIPRALHEYCQTALQLPMKQSEEDWLPRVWEIDAPNLAAIEVHFGKQDDGKYYILKLDVGDSSFMMKEVGARYITSGPYFEDVT